MAFLQGHSRAAFVPTGGPQTAGVQMPAGAQRDMVVIDGTPVRVVVLMFAAAAGLTALRFAGFKFNVGVSS